MTATDQGKTNPRAAIAEPAATSQPASSPTRAASRLGRAARTVAVVAPSGSDTAGLPRLGAGPPTPVVNAMDAAELGGRYAPGGGTRGRSSVKANDPCSYGRAATLVAGGGSAACRAVSGPAGPGSTSGGQGVCDSSGPGSSTASGAGSMR